MTVRTIVASNRRPRTEPFDATVIYVAYGTDALDLRWVPPSANVIVTHNDACLDPASVSHARVEHVHLGSNIGFGAAVNIVLPLVTTGRVILANPDTSLEREHFDALAVGTEHEVRAIPLVDHDGAPTAAIGSYPSPFTAVLNAYRVGRWLPRGGPVRKAALRVLGRAGRAHQDGLDAVAGQWPLSERWASGAVVSFPLARLRELGGFDPRYFLYVEDVDLCERLAARHPEMVLVVPDVPPGRHAVGGTAGAAGSGAVARHRVHSWYVYACEKRTVGWRVAAFLIGARERWIDRA